MKLGVPSKGRLKKEVLSWFNHKGVEIITSEDDRSYAAKVTGFSDIQLFFLPPIEIPTLLSNGALDLGVTGQDLIEEKSELPSEEVEKEESAPEIKSSEEE